jgi:hypothetical protein
MTNTRKVNGTSYIEKSKELLEYSKYLLLELATKAHLHVQFRIKLVYYKKRKRDTGLMRNLPLKSDV